MPSILSQSAVLAKKNRPSRSRSALSLVAFILMPFASIAVAQPAPPKLASPAPRTARPLPSEADQLSDVRRTSGSLEFFASTSISDYVVRLGDLAKVQTADKDRGEYLRSLVLYTAPERGASRHLRSRHVHEELLLRNVDLSGLTLSGASRIHVTRISTPTETSPLKPTGYSRPGSPTPHDDLGQVVVLARKVRRGERLSQFDVKLVPASDANLRNLDPIRDVKNILGRELTRSVDEGDAIDRSWVIEPILVRRNAIVSVTVRVGGIQIRTTGKSRQDATLNDIIELESLKDRKTTWTGRVTGIDAVEILAQGSTYEPRVSRATNNE